MGFGGGKPTLSGGSSQYMRTVLCLAYIGRSSSSCESEENSSFHKTYLLPLLRMTQHEDFEAMSSGVECASSQQLKGLSNTFDLFYFTTIICPIYRT